MGTFIDALTWDSATAKLAGWMDLRETRYVCLCNVHSVAEASRNPEFGRVLTDADMALPDGAPVAWMLRRLGFAGQARLSGPDFMARCCEQAERLEHAIFLYGGTAETLEALQRELSSRHPNLQIVGAYSPPFRQLSSDEDEEIVTRINASGARLVWVGLGCPKQEIWMAQHRGRIKAVMVGVGAAFDFHGGMVKRAPMWMQRAGLEWLHRLCSEPRRLWRRYLLTNTQFIMYSAREIFGSRFARVFGRQ